MINRVIIHLYQHEYYAEIYNGDNMIPYGEYGRNKTYSKEYIESKIVSIFGPSTFTFEYV